MILKCKEYDVVDKVFVNMFGNKLLIGGFVDVKLFDGLGLFDGGIGLFDLFRGINWNVFIVKYDELYYLNVFFYDLSI